jgi:hypothetical protein
MVMWEFKLARLMTSGPPVNEPKGGVPFRTWEKAGRATRKREKRVASEKRCVCVIVVSSPY